HDGDSLLTKFFDSSRGRKFIGEVLKYLNRAEIILASFNERSDHTEIRIRRIVVDHPEYLISFSISTVDEELSE
ncbi:hypothetical protein PFISCL1PPCAC_6519, partial [Pristionchus fissidentatus]